MPKIIKYITELKFRRGTSGHGVVYNVNIPALLNTILSIREHDTVFVPVEPMTCEVDAKDDKILMRCEV